MEHTEVRSHLAVTSFRAFVPRSILALNSGNRRSITRENLFFSLFFLLFFLFSVPGSVWKKILRGGPLLTWMASAGVAVSIISTEGEICA